MQTPIKWVDFYEMSKERSTLTENELGIPGIRLFAMLHPQTAIAPLVPHFHNNAFEISLITQGHLSFYTNNEDYVVPGGSVFISYPNEIHSTHGAPLSPLKMYWLQIDVSNPEQFLFLDKKSAQNLIDSLSSLNKHLIKTDNKEIRKVIEKAFRLSLEKCKPMLVTSYILTFLELLLTCADQVVLDESHEIQDVTKYIHNHIYDNLDLDDLAARSSLSLSQFKVNFARIMGTPPRQYINHAKVDYAKKLLRSGLSVTEVAMQLGFSSSSYFATVFKKYVNCSPLKYSKMNQKQP